MGSPSDIVLGSPLRSLIEPLPSLDARTCLLRTVKQYVALLVFGRKGDRGGPDKTFRVPLENIHEEQPDDPENLRFPAVAFLPAQGEHLGFGLGPPKFVEDSVDVYGKGTVLVHASDYEERLTVEVWGAHKAERHSLMAGLDLAFRNNDGSYATFFKLTNYYDRIASVWVESVQYVDDPDVVRGRRRGHLVLWVSVPEVQLVRYQVMRPQVDVETYDGAVTLDLASAKVPAE